MTIVSPEPRIERDRYGRPMVLLPNGKKKVAYTRCTRFIDCIDDRYNLERWFQRMVALGLASRPDLLLSVNAHREDKKQLDKICDDAKEAAAASAAATTGTALHALTELVDRGIDLPVGLPPGVVASLDAYREATKDFTATHIEQFCVQDWLKVGGTPDRVVKHQGTSYIADLKTGSIEWGVLKIAMQLAVYARSHTYDVATGARGDHQADNQRGLIIHLPAVEDPALARCDIFWVDLVEGWNSVIVARTVREKRALKFRDLATPFGPDLEVSLADSIRAEIDKALDPDAIRALWREDWSQDLTDYAAQRVASLDGNTAA